MLSPYFLNASEDEKITHLKNLWAVFALEKKSFSSQDIVFLTKDPFFANHPIAWAILSLWGVYFSLDLPVKTWDIASLSLVKRCELALLYKMVGREETEWMASIALCLEFPSLFSEEKQYALEKGTPMISLFSKAAGLGNECIKIDYSNAYFKALDVFLPSISISNHLENPWVDIFSFQRISYAFVKHGKKVGIGALKSSKISVPTFGFGGKTIDDEDVFGVSFPEAESCFGYITCLKDVWFQLLNFKNRGGFDVRIYGVKPEDIVSFCYFVVADTASVLDAIFHKQSLQTFKGIADEINFSKDGEVFTIKNNGKLKVDLIPLACDASFWGSSFLVRFQVPSGVEKISFEFDLKCTEF